MFTGIIEETGVVQRVETTAGGIRLAIQSKVCASGLKPGDSLAVNGCCLTAVKAGRAGAGRVIEFDLLKETWRRTNLQFAHVGSVVNLERPVPADGRLGGHFVTGHIDGMGLITRWELIGTDRLLEISAEPALLRYVVFKASIAVDGISLTVASVRKKSFQIWIIPHTYRQTGLHECSLGDRLNLETDILAKYVERLCQTSSRKA
jgi:riboflavin synthase